MKTPIALLLGVALCLVACKSKEEQAREKALEKRADALENQADRIKDAGDAQAKADKEAGKDQANIDKADADALSEALKKAAE
jgi:hypothetical protein